MKARDAIVKEYGKSKNFMTPSVIRCGWIAKGRMAYELSTGEGIMRGTTIYGVSVVAVDDEGNTKRAYDLSKCCHSITEAEDYIESLKGEHQT